MRLRLFSFLLFGLGLLAFSVLGTSNADPIPKQFISPPASEQAAGSEFMRYELKPGTALQIFLQTPINTATNQAGDPVEGAMTQNLYLGDTLLLSKNTRLTGSIVRLDPPMQGRNAILAIRFNEIILDNGERLPIESHLKTEHPEHIWGGEATPGTKPYLSTQRVWGIGEYNRVVYGGPRAMGHHIEFLPGERWTLVLEQPLTIVKATEEP